MDITDIKKLALTARITVSDDEAQGLLSDLAGVLTYIDRVRNAIVSDEEYVVPTHRNACREDIVTNESGMFTELLMAQVPSKQDGYAKVKKIM